jgi:hypothetical protein
MTTPYDLMPIEVRRVNFGWFGEPWPSGICYDDDGQLIADMRKPFPVGESCFQCGELLDEAAGDSGKAMPFTDATGCRIVHAHKECLFMDVAGPLAHLERRCRHFGGDEHGTPGMTRREEAIEVWSRLQAGTLFSGGEG